MMTTTTGQIDHDALPDPTEDRGPQLPDLGEDIGPEVPAGWWLDIGCGD